MTSLKLARITAVLIGTGTFAFLFLTDSWHLGNLFLVPDLLLCAALLIAAALPDRAAGLALPAAFCFSAGVLITAVASYAVDGRIGVAALAGCISSVVMAVVLLRTRARIA